MQPWLTLIGAGLLEVVWATAMKRSHGFTLLWPSVLTIVTMLASFGLLALAMRSLPQSVSYPVWVGIGAVGTAIAGVVLLGERLVPAQWVCIGAIALGIAGLIALKPKEAAVPTAAGSSRP